MLLHNLLPGESCEKRILLLRIVQFIIRIRLLIICCRILSFGTASAESTSRNCAKQGLGSMVCFCAAYKFGSTRLIVLLGWKLKLLLARYQRYGHPGDDDYEATSPKLGRALVSSEGLVVLRVILNAKNLANEHPEPTCHSNTGKIYMKTGPFITKQPPGQLQGTRSK